MTDQESAYIKALALAVADLQTRLTRLEAFVLSVNKRLQFNEAALVIEEIDEGIPKEEIH